MKNLPLLLKFSLASFLFLLLFMAFYIPNALSHAEEETYAKLARNLTHDLGNEERLIENIGVTNAIFIADNRRIKKALVEEDRDAAIEALNTIFDKFRKSTTLKELKVHIHTADLKSFIRSWKLNKFGDDLSGFRKTIVKVKETLQPVFNFEVGRIGLTLRSIVPILEGDSYLGSLEFMQSFDNVPKNFEKRGNHHLLLMDDSLIDIATDLKDAPDVDHYKLCSKSFNSGFLKAAQALDLDALRAAGHLYAGQYLFTYKRIEDMDKNSVGMHLLGMSGQQVKHAVDDAKNKVLSLTAIIFFSFILVMFFLIVLQSTWSNKTK
jgi:methyl-accepting chemotaxis protein